MHQTQRMPHAGFFFFCFPSTGFRVVVSPDEASRLHSLDWPHFAGLIWTSDQLVAEISDNT